MPIRNSSFSSLHMALMSQSVTLLHYAGKVCQTSIYAQWSHLKLSIERKSCEYNCRDCIQNTSNSLKLMNGPNTLECYISICQKGVLQTSIYAQWSHLNFSVKKKCLNMIAWTLITRINFLCNLFMDPIRQSVCPSQALCNLTL